MEHFKNYGPGIYLFFLFIKKAIVLFCILAALDLIPLIYNYVEGNGFGDSITSFQVFAAMSMMGNHVSDGEYSSNEVRDKLLVAIPDMVSIVVFMGFYFYWSITYKK